MASVQMKYLGAADVGPKLKGHAAAVKAHLTEAIFFWHEHYLPIHFTTDAYQRYPGVYKERFKDRTLSEYLEDIREGGRLWADSEEAKQKRKKLRNPMVWTGRMRLLASAKITVTGTSKKMKGALAGTNTANLHQGTNPLTGGYNMPLELTTLNAEENEKILGLLNMRYEEFHRTAQPVRSVRADSKGASIAAG